ncbi:MAG: hypothetical protein RR750_21905, partial [Citrobacter sp.]
MTTCGKAAGKSERLAVLNNAEQEALYSLPDFQELYYTKDSSAYRYKPPSLLLAESRPHRA